MSPKGEGIFTEAIARNAELLLDFAREQGLSLCTAESLTGGLLGASIVSISGASSAFRGSLCAYQTPIKASVLGVDPEILEQFGAVSAECAYAMATRAIQLFDADCALATTGVAGPLRDERDNPVGTVFVGCAYRGAATVFFYQYPENLTRPQIQQATIEDCLRDALEWLKSSVRPSE